MYNAVEHTHALRHSTPICTLSHSLSVSLSFTHSLARGRARSLSLTHTHTFRDEEYRRMWAEAMQRRDDEYRFSFKKDILF
jgi:hypothetical protein